MRNKKYPRRGEVYWVNFDATKGSETSKTRPGLIISNDIGNEESDIVMVAPITSKVGRVYPFEVKTKVNGYAAKIMVNQCRAIDKSRLHKKIEVVDSEIMNAVEEAIKIVFDLR